MANQIEFSILGKDKFSRAVNKSRVALNNAVKYAAGFGVAAGAAFGTAAKAIIDVGDKTETLRLRMSTMLGSAAEGNQVFQDMSKFAGEVPFAYEEIMESATQLSGVMKGGVKEINEWMPMIADLAAVSGLGIEQTTEQVVRMYSAGAGAADLFRERGITSMLGFQAGVSYSAQETKERLIQAFEDPMSKFRGASADLADTWTGLMSMLGDKWFQMKSQIADAGLFNYFKALAATIDGLMSGALENTAENANRWSNAIIEGIRGAAQAVGWLGNIFRGLEFVWDALKVLYAEWINGIIQGMYGAVDSIREFINIIPGVDVSPMEKFRNVADASRMTVNQLKKELEETAAKEMPTDQVDGFMKKVEEHFTRYQAKSAEVTEAVKQNQGSVTQNGLDQFNEQMNNMQEHQQASLDHMITYSESYKDIFNSTMGDIWLNAQTLGEQTSEIIRNTYDTMTEGIGNAIASAIVDGENLGKALKKLLKKVIKDIIAQYITMQVQRAIMTAMFGTAAATELAVEGAKAVALAGANGVASWAAAPWPINLGAPAFGIKMAAAAKAQLAAGKLSGALHGGLDNVPNEATYLLQRGERVLSPNQNTDLTSFLSGDTSAAGGGGVVIENLNISVLENATSADALLEMSQDQIDEVVAGPIIESLDRLRKQGIVPNE